ncbi:MAG: M23 family metallopeptidase, partial [Candidatus Limnocylindrales bacterium]
RGDCAHFHDGIDIANASGTPILAAASGVIAFVGFNPYEQTDPAFVVVIGHAGGVTTQYVHLLPRYADGVSAGAFVNQGQIIGYMGSTGNSTGSHLHFQVHVNDNPTNPRDLL